MQEPSPRAPAHDRFTRLLTRIEPDPRAYGVFAAEARDVEPEYAPETVNTDGWAATRNAFLALFPRSRWCSASCTGS